MENNMRREAYFCLFLLEDVILHIFHDMPLSNRFGTVNKIPYRTCIICRI